ncbi:MAG: copper resistance protein B [Bordetella sp.]|nr:copper resistance protein B [Bordetella sp.]
MPMPMQMPMPAPADGAVPVGSLPSSDGGIGKPYADYGITLHTMDHAVFWQFSADEFEWARSNHGGTVRAWDGAFTLGTDYNKLVVQSEGERSDGATDAQLEVQWRRAFSPFWNTQLGWRRDLGTGPKRDWAAFGVTGTLPYDIETEATAYVGESGRTALKLKAEYDLSFTQRLVLTPEIEANLYGRSDPARGIGSGLSDASLALRLRYEITRQFAPYVGVSFGRKFGQAASLASDEGESRSEVLWLAGVRFWF